MLLVPGLDRPEVPTSTPIAIAYLQIDNRSAADRYKQIAGPFGMLPSEALFALAFSRGLCA